MRLRKADTNTSLLATVILFVVNPSSAFYLPGVAPTSYKFGDRVPLNVNHLTPSRGTSDSQLRSVVAYDYYFEPFMFCKPEEGAKYVTESLGSILFGDRIRTSPFELSMSKNVNCKKLCEVEFNQQDAKFVNARIREGYNINWLIDGLPAAGKSLQLESGELVPMQGFLLGKPSPEPNTPKLHNHFDIKIDYHELKSKERRVVGVQVEPSSRLTGGSETDCGDSDSLPVSLSEAGGSTKVSWTYSVEWSPSTTAWATRWDKYLHVYLPSIHWWSLISSAAIVVLLVFMVTSILLRALRKDIARYNRLDTFSLDDLSGTSAAVEDGVQEDSGWKLVHGDVFRSPRHSLILSIFLGNGAQLFVMTGITIFFALFGFLSPSYRGSLATAMILLYAIFGFVGGYVSARVYKSLGGEAWKQNIALTPLLVSGIVFAVFFFLNLFLWASKSSGAVPFSTMLVIIIIWFVISVPLSFAGSWTGLKQAAIKPPVRTNQIPRQIPPAANYFNYLPSMLMTGIPPFGAISVELFFIIESLWFNQVYYMFGFLFLCYFLMIITCAAVTVLMIYFLLCSENYHWHWRAFNTAGACSIYVFLSALGYQVMKMSLGGVTSNVLYLGYSILISFLCFILTGTIGFFASWAFVHKIYGSIKID